MINVGYVGFWGDTNEDNANKLIYPLGDKWKVNSFRFMEDCSYANHQNEMIHWGLHLGEDCNTKPSTKVKAIGNGIVVHSATYPGCLEKRNWGGLIIIRHKNKLQNFYSLYGHLNNIKVEEGSKVCKGKTIGMVAEGPSAENGWWEDSHLHFAIYTGPYKNGKILVGYYRKDQKYTELKYWREPTKYIEEFNQKAR